MWDPSAEAVDVGLEHDIRTLRRALERLTTIASGLHRRLDADLLVLRQMIEAGAPTGKIEAQVESIATTLLEVNQLDDDNQRRTSDPLRQLLALLASNPVPPALQDEGRALQTRVRDGESEAPWHDALQLTQRALRQLAAPGLLQRLFGAAPASPTVPGRARGVEVPPRAREALLALLDQLMLPDGVAADIEELRQRLSANVPLHDLAELLEALARLVSAASRSENEALRHFLGQLNNRLLDLEGFLAYNAKQTEAGRRDSGQLSEDVGVELRALRDGLEAAESVEALRSLLPQRLDAIGHRLQRYLATQEQRRHDDETRLRRLQRQLRETEADAETLRQSLMQQRVRSQTDTLTGLANREAYRERLEHEYARWRRSRAPLTLLLCDVDHFKTVNDRFGHQVGDQVLQKIGQIFSERLRRSDLAARYGGEEFVVLMPDTRIRDAFNVAESLREAIAAAPFGKSETNPGVTVSFGIAGFLPGDTPESAFARADEALYRAKDAGRNRTEITDQSTEAGDNPIR